MKHIILFVAMLVLATGLVSAANCGGATACNCGDTLTSDHTMWYDLMGCGGNAINFGGTDIALNCDGHSISGAPGGYGINIQPNNNYGLITNCEISNFSEGIHIGAWYYNVVNNDIHDSITSISISHSYHNTIIDNLIHGSNTGLNMYDVKFNEIHNNEINGHTEGVHLASSSGENTFWNNYFENNIVQVSPGGTANEWNLGTVGNYWDDFIDNPGFPDYYEINPSNIDYYPIYGYCGQVVSDDITFIDDLLDCPSDGLDVIADGITIDCAGHLIDGTGSGYGVYLNGRHDVTLKDCIIKEFYKGVQAESSHSISIIDNIIQNNGNGTSFYDSYENMILDNIISENSGNGITLWFESDNNEIAGNTIENNDYGIQTYRPEGNFIHDNSISNNSQGIQLWDSDSNLIQQNTIGKNTDGGISIYYSNDNLLWDNQFDNPQNNGYEEGTGTYHNHWNSSTTGNSWSDFPGNPGYPDYYEIPGPGDGIDHYPIHDFNDPPEFLAIGDRYATEGQTLIIDADATDPENNTLTYHLSTDIPTPYIFDEDEGILNWTPTYFDSGNYQAEFSVTDGEYSDSETINIEVMNVPYTDFEIVTDDIIFSDDYPLKKDTVTITAIFRNLLETDPSEVLVRFYSGQPLNQSLIGEDLVQIRRSTFFAQAEYTP
ncbi:right-handed parallel beta-helix repeat-containing protein, partial [bacterium]|nr:right-handed parallel beta-helix repeat-containing protein [bacterium]MBU1026086.1 right-handed parallel beta-helix repeat-containing protein [bacterium]